MPCSVAILTLAPPRLARCFRNEPAPADGMTRHTTAAAGCRTSVRPSGQTTVEPFEEPVRVESATWIATDPQPSRRTAFGTAARGRLLGGAGHDAFLNDRLVWRETSSPVVIRGREPC